MYLLLFPIIAVITTSVSLNISKCINIYYCKYFVIYIETTRSFISVSTPASTISSYYLTGIYSM